MKNKQVAEVVEIDEIVEIDATIDAAANVAQTIVKPIELARVINVAAQFIYAKIRENKIPSHRCICDHSYLIASEVAESEFYARLSDEKKAAFDRAFSA